jgi:hypothetical protein
MIGPFPAGHRPTHCHLAECTGAEEDARDYYTRAAQKYVSAQEPHHATHVLERLNRLSR